MTEKEKKVNYLNNPSVECPEICRHECQSGILTRKRVKKKHWKHQKSCLHTASFMMKVKQILFKRFPQLSFFWNKNMLWKMVLIILVPKIKFFPWLVNCRYRRFEIENKNIIWWSKPKNIFNLIVIQIYNMFVC